MARLIVITGVPATGKTSLAGLLGKKLGWPVISKDGIKERLYDALGCDTRDQSRAYGKAALDILFSFAHSLLANEVSCIIEANFRPEFDTARVQALLDKTGGQLIQIMCKGESEVVFERFRERALTGARHAGHCEPDHLEEFRANIFQGLPKLEVGGTYFEFNTTMLDEGILNNITDKIITLHCKDIRFIADPHPFRIGGHNL